MGSVSADQILLKPEQLFVIEQPVEPGADEDPFIKRNNVDICDGFLQPFCSWRFELQRFQKFYGLVCRTVLFFDSGQVFLQIGKLLFFF